jgi:hypothetical protein
MINQSTSYHAETNNSNILAKNIELILFLVIIIFLIFSLASEKNLTDKLIKFSMLFVVIFFQILHFIKLLKEPTFLSITHENIILRPSFYILKRTISFNDIIGYSQIQRPYFINKGRTKLNYSAYLLYLKNGNKILITEYYFLNFNLLSKNLKKTGVKFLGSEDREWNRFKRKFRYD